MELPILMFEKCFFFFFLCVSNLILIFFITLCSATGIPFNLSDDAPSFSRGDNAV